MSWLINFCKSSIGKKAIMAVTGLSLCVFLLSHLAGNLLMLHFIGGRTEFNAYAEYMSTAPLIRIAEVGLVFGFLFHILDGLILSRQNAAAREHRYEVNKPEKNSKWWSRWMGTSGMIILIFLVVHLDTFFVPHRIQHVPETMYDTVRQSFLSPWYSGFYLISFAILGFHLIHGFQSAFQSLGLNHLKYTPIVKWFGIIFFGVLIPLGYAVIPVYFLFGFDQ